MFSHDELLSYPSLPGADDDLPLMQVAEFLEHQLTRPQPGQSITAHCGEKEDFSSALVFWFWSLQLTDGAASRYAYARFAEETLCEPINAQTYFEKIELFIAGVKRPAPQFLRRRESFVSGMKMFRGVVVGDWRNSLLAEFPNDFVAFHFRIPT